MVLSLSYALRTRHFLPGPGNAEKGIRVQSSFDFLDMGTFFSPKVTRYMCLYIYTHVRRLAMYIYIDISCIYIYVILCKYCEY